MDWLVISGVNPWDGRYPFDFAETEPTTREWGHVKRLSGYLPLTIEDGLRGADPELVCAFAVIALTRAGKITHPEAQTVFDRLADAPFGASIRLETDTADLAADGDRPLPASSDASSSSSGDDGRTSSETSAPTPPPSGTPASATSESPPPALVI